jgi:hypothetical protein
MTSMGPLIRERPEVAARVFDVQAFQPANDIARRVNPGLVLSAQDLAAGAHALRREFFVALYPAFG